MGARVCKCECKWEDGKQTKLMLTPNSKLHAYNLIAKFPYRKDLLTKV
jgi:hypothetical protein